MHSRVDGVSVVHFNIRGLFSNRFMRIEGSRIFRRTGCFKGLSKRSVIVFKGLSISFPIPETR